MIKGVPQGEMLRPLPWSIKTLRYKLINLEAMGVSCTANAHIRPICKGPEKTLMFLLVYLLLNLFDV